MGELIIGLMSGTSLDGIDLVACRFSKSNGSYDSFEIVNAETVSYPTIWKNKLSESFLYSEAQTNILDLEYGEYLASCILNFIAKHQIQPILIGSHGHTILHQPSKGITLQIGNGQIIHQLTKINVINNFRYQDVALGGQGAPLVPIGDELLFSNYDFCLNLGGFSNISYKENKIRYACDIGPCNMLLNALANQCGLDFDSKGSISQSGNVISELLTKWNTYDFYKLDGPKSLGKEWFVQNFLEDIQNSVFEINHLLRTSTEHISKIISDFIISKSSHYRCKVLVTGGGAHNDFLLNRLKEKSGECIEYIIPDSNLVDFKEAMIFALLAQLKMDREINVLSSVTGASKNHSSGDMWITD